MQRAIDRLGYTPNRAARNLRTRTSHLVGLRLDPATARAILDEHEGMTVDYAVNVWWRRF